VRNYADALRVVKLGAARIGTSSTAAIAAGEQTGTHDIRGQESY